MVDRAARDQMAELVRHLATDRISEKEFDNALERIDSVGYDPAIEAIFEETCRIDRVKRRDIARCILFLYSDSEYKWPGYGDPNPYLILAGVASAIAIGTMLHEAKMGFHIVFGLAAVSAIADAVQKRRQSNGDTKAWPFLHQADLDQAVKHPRLLSGKG